MSVSIKKAFLAVVMTLVLLAGMAGWNASLHSAPLAQPHHTVSSSQSHGLPVSYIKPYPGCPPPPFAC